MTDDSDKPKKPDDVDFGRTKRPTLPPVAEGPLYRKPPTTPPVPRPTPTEPSRVEAIPPPRPALTPPSGAPTPPGGTSMSIGPESATRSSVRITTPTGGSRPLSTTPTGATPPIATPSTGVPQPFAAGWSAPSPSDAGWSQPTADPGWSQPVPTADAGWSQPAPMTYDVGSGQPTEEPLLPSTYSENELRSAVGIAPIAETPSKALRKPPEPRPFDDDDDDDDGKKKGGGKRMMIFVAIMSVILGLTVAAFVFLGRSNSDRWVISCQARQIVAQRGRSFPPWGESMMKGAQWKPIAIPPEAECEGLDTEEFDTFQIAFRQKLVERADALLLAGDGSKVDEAAAMLEQGLLLTREQKSSDARKYIQRMLGDVVYWRASAKLKEAATALDDAAKQFDSAATSQPRHVNDANAWATFVRDLEKRLQSGPAGQKTAAFPPAPPGTERPPAPPGVALPVEPAGSGSDKTAEEPAKPDAGVPGGGVLL